MWMYDDTSEVFVRHWWAAYNSWHFDKRPGQRRWRPVLWTCQDVQLIELDDRDQYEELWTWRYTDED